MISDQQRTCFQFKASFSPCTILQLHRYDYEELEKQLTDTIARAPNMFFGIPVIIDLEKIKEESALDFPKLKSILIKVGLAPMGVRGGSDEQTQMAATAGLPLVKIGKTSVTKEKVSEPETNESMVNEPIIKEPSETPKSKKTAKKAEKIETEVHPTKIITHPIRSGMQVYAKESDLIIVGPVSSGAELLSDGHIHVYGPLRGRALAGLMGNTQARIFCRTLEAELVSIAGFYLTKEDMQVLPAHDGMIQIYLANEQVKIEAI